MRARAGFGGAAAASFLGGSALVASVRAHDLESLEWGILAVLLATGTSFSAVLLSARARRAGLLLPLSFVGLWIITFGLASVAWRNPNELEDVLARGLRVESIPTALAVTAVGLLAWAIGFAFLRLRLVEMLVSGLSSWSTRDANGSNPIAFLVERVLAIYAVGLLARLLIVAVGRYSYLTADLQAAITQSSPIVSILSQLEFLTVVGLLLMTYIVAQGATLGVKSCFAMMIATEMAFGLLSGMRSSIILRLVGIVVLYYLVRHRVPVLVPVSLVVLLAVLSPFNQAYRAEVRQESETTLGAAEAARLIPSLLMGTASELTVRGALSAPTDFVTGRLRLIDDVSIVVQKTPHEIPYTSAFDTMTEAASVLVPRALWPSKPVFTVGLDYARDYWNQPQTVISSRSPSYPGEAFRRGGWAGVVILMALVGGIMGAINTGLLIRAKVAAAPLFVVAWSEFLTIEGSLVLLVAGLIQALVVTAIAMRWAGRVHRVEPALPERPRRMGGHGRGTVVQ